ncbi:hypothetical protein [Ilumatobacter sp.]|uniref:hypothetical protein n=1 Tax=Ilumatobacter sp. TaxID=1967498 RepID=UPI003AF8360A
MSNTVVVIVVVVAVVVVAVAIAARARRSNDGVDSFRRQIDALSPEARRPVIDQVQSAAGRQPDEDAVDDEPDDEDGARGT